MDACRNKYAERKEVRKLGSWKSGALGCIDFWMNIISIYILQKFLKSTELSDTDQQHSVLMKKDMQTLHLVINNNLISSSWTL